MDGDENEGVFELSTKEEGGANEKRESVAYERPKRKKK
jgi:hypothetical protein